ncbi:phage tail protein [Halodesulfovibrio marinisediminis]|uniref:Phage tail-collar fibre protein n=1 Tax=Halodesulfovibrio marinisediminis DSM 17456 TaxID=1121457 RepID=A0A1N6I148_9BACT|nr:phage tail protein [Halodesulfovibrio marinisediminis]SIO25740.1 Phage tail-collar fibre protein [Halodesulfovibrio marinisediminis DSM 17456]
MPQKYYPQITQVGLEKLTKASLMGKKLTLSHMAVGDGSNPVIDIAATKLKHEVYRAAIDEVSLDKKVANRVQVTLVIPVEVGGFNITELGVFDSDGDLIAISRFPATYKPGLNEGSGREIRVQMTLQLSNANVINIQIDRTVAIATKQDVHDHNNDPDAHPRIQQHIKDRNDPHGTIPDGGKTGQVLIKQADGGIAWGTVAGVPVGELCFSTNGLALPGTIPVNVKQKVLCSAFPQLFEWMKGGTYLRSEAAWDAEAAAQDGSCGKYCWDGGEYFILPCYTRYFAAAHEGKVVGSWDGDAIRKIAGTFPVDDDIRLNSTHRNLYTGAFVCEESNITPYDETSSHSINSQNDGGKAKFDSSRVVPTADENRPKTSYVLPCIKAFDVPVNAAHVDMLALAKQVAAINGNKADKASFANLLSDFGWQKFEGGLILQWGWPCTKAGAGYWHYPIAFPTKCFCVLCSEDASDLSVRAGAVPDLTNATTVKTRAKISSSYTSGADGILTIAIGY